VRINSNECLSLQVILSVGVDKGGGNDKMNKSEARPVIKYLQKENITPKETWWW
jgi:hypothetical protein